MPQPGQSMRKVKISEVAADAGVSRATVDRVLNRRGGVSIEKERAVLLTAKALGLDRNLKVPPIKALRVCVLMKPPQNPFYEQLVHGFKEANLLFAQQAITAYVSHIDVLAPEAIRQRLVRLTANYDALILIVPVHEKLLDVLRQIATKIPVVTLATDLPLEVPHHYVGPSNYESGRLAGELMGRLIGKDGGRVLLVAGLENFSGHREREMGFASVLADDYPQCPVSVRIESHDQGALVADAIAAALRRDPTICGIYNISQGNDEIARRIGSLRAKRLVVFIGHDLTPTSRALLKSRQMDVVIDQDPVLEARRSIEIVLQHYGRSDGLPARGTTPIRVVLRENAGREDGNTGD